MKIKARPHANVLATAYNIALAFAVYMVCRILYVAENWNLFSAGWGALSVGELLRGGVRFDASAIAYTNFLYVFLMLLPLHFKERKGWHTAMRWIYTVVNALGVIANLSDAVYSQYTGRRTTSTFFREFSNEGNLGTIFFTEVINHWYLVIAGAALIAALWFLYAKPEYGSLNKSTHWKSHYYLSNAIALALAIPLSVICIRGGATKAIRPITLSNANQYVNQPAEAAIVLNTPFTLIRTIGKTTFHDPAYMPDSVMEQIYSPLHKPTAKDSSGNVFEGKNVVILIVESFGREYIGFYNRDLEEGSYKGYTPFVDSLLGQSLTWQHTFANGRKSIDAMPSVLSSIPMFVEPFFVTNYSLNKVGGIATELGRKGYTSAFFHGAENGSMGFQAFAKTTGFQRYYGRDEYNADKRFGGDNDFDGTWAIWDEPFLQFFATTMNDLPEPFVSAVFTASSHHPFVIPSEYKEIFPEEELPMHKCIRYTDLAIRRFFETAAKQPWYKNTIFILTSDHTNMSNHDIYKTSIGSFSAPILFFDPSHQLITGTLPGIAQQIDIMPTLLGILGFDETYVAFGKDLLTCTPHESWAINYANGIYQYVCRDTLTQFDGERVTGCYNTADDPLLKRKIKPSENHVNKIKAIVQQYMQRMVGNRLTAENDGLSLESNAQSR